MSQKKIQNPDVEKRALQLQYSFEHGVDLENRIIRIGEEIDEGHFSWLDAALTELESSNRKGITIRINSPGGSVYEALAMVGRIKSSSCKITTEGYGHIMSAAIAILAAGHKRRMSEYAWFMHHEAAYSAEGKHSDIKDLVHQCDRENVQFSLIMSQFTNQSASFWKKLSEKKEAYFTPEQCLRYEIVDEVI